MSGWIQAHGFETLLIYYVLVSLVGSMPDLPPTAGYFAKWAYGFMHLFAGNWRQLLDTLPKDATPQR